MIVRLAVSAAVLLSLPATALANDVSKRSWGGIEFSDSDRDTQADGDTVAIAQDPSTGGLVSVGTAGGSYHLYRFDPNGRQTQRLKIPKSTAVTVLQGGEPVVGAASGKVTGYGPGGSTFSAGSPVVALASDAASNIYVATSSAITRYSATGAKQATFPIAGAKSVAVDPGGAIYVADGATARLYDASGTLVRALGGLTAPDRIAVDSTGRVFVHDTTGGGFDVKVFTGDGTALGSTTSGFYDLQSEAKDSPGDPVLLAVAGAGDVYFVAENPDILRIPAAVVPGPRFRIDDPSRAVPQFYDTDPIAVSVGKTASFTTNVFRSLSSGLSISLAAPPALKLAPGVPSATNVSIPAGADFAPVEWRFSVDKPGRVPVTLTARGTGPDGNPTTQAKKLPVYGIDGPNITIQGAATRPGAKYSLVAIQVDIGKTKIAKADRADLIEYLSNTFEVGTTARINGKKVDELGFEIGESLTGMCVPFPTKGFPRIAVTAKVPGSDRFAAATAKRTVRPTAKPTTALMKACYQAIDLAGI